MAVIGYATLQIIPSMRGMEGAIRSELRGADAIGRAAGEQLGQGVTGRFRSAMGGLMGSVGRTLEAGATTVGLAAGAVLGTSLFAGFQRLTTIEDATRALEVTLKDSTKAGALLAKVLEIVTGTPFSLDQFAAGAQQLVAFGVSAEKVPSILTAVGDASATQGKRAGEFAGQLIAVFGQIAAKGRVQLQDVWRISETGVNALGILSNHFGVTTEAMQKMIEKGTVPAGEAIDALASGIETGSSGIAGQTVALGGTMKALGDTLSGSFANLKISIARFGASILTPLSKPLTNFFKAMRTGIDALGKKLGARLTELAESPGFQKFLNWLTTLPAQIGPVVAALGDLGPALAPLLAAVAAIASTNLANALGPLGAFLPTINPVFAAIAALIATQPELRKAFGKLVEAIQPLLAELGPVLAKVVATAARILVAVLVPAINAVTAVVEFFKRNPDVFAALAVGLAAIATTIGVVLLPAFIAWAAAAGAAAIATLAAAAPFIAIGVAVAAVALVIIKNFDSIKGAASAVFNWIKDHWGLILTILGGPFGAAVTVVAEHFDTIRNTVQTALRFIVDKFLAVIEWIIRGAARAFGWVPGIGGNLREAAKSFEEFRDSVNASLGGIKDKTVNIKINSSGLLPKDTPHAKGIPEFALGGVVPGPVGKPVLALVHGGETVVPPTSQRPSGIPLGLSPSATYEIVVPFVVNGREFHRETIRFTSEELERYRKDRSA